MSNGSSAVVPPSASREEWREALALLDVALELEPAALAAWLESLGRSQASQAALVRRLLDERSAIEMGSFMHLPAVAGLVATRGLQGPREGSLVGPYRLLREIGQGGSASVWLAERADGVLERRVALKLPHVGWGAGFAEQIARERNILASLTHPNIARLYDAGSDADGRPYLAIEFIEGQPIDVYARTRGLTVAARVELIVQVARAIGHAHTRLVVHRDLKPSNVLADASGRVHLLDFGIARLLDPLPAEMSASSPLTLSMARALTPDYASPEQIRGEPIGTGTDIYSLGVVAFELLAGQRPYRLDAGLGLAALADAMAAMPPRRASEMASDKEFRRALRGDLDAIVGRMLAQRADERYETADAVADDLERHLRGEPVRARPASPGYTAGRWLRRHKLEAGVGLALLLALAGGAYAQVIALLAVGAGALVALWQRRRALEQAALAKAALARGERVKDFIASIFTQAVPRAGRGGPVAAADLLRAAARRIETDLAAQPAVAAELAALVGSSFVELGDARAAFDWLPKAVALCMRELGPLHPLTLQSRRCQVEAANVVGELATAEQLLPALLRDLRSALPAEAEALVGALQSDSFVHAKRGREGDAVAALEEAVRVAEQHGGTTSSLALIARSELSNTHLHFARPAEALRVIETAVGPALAAFGDLRPHACLIAVERAHADALAASQRPRDATPLMRRVLADQRKLDVDDTDRVRIAIALLARTLLLRGHLDEAHALYAEAYAMHERLTGGCNDEGVVGLTWLAFTAALRGDGAAGIAFARRAEAIEAPAKVLQALITRSVRALAEAVAGRHDAAIASAEAVLRDAQSKRGAIALRAVRAHAMALRGSGDAAAAIAVLDAMRPTLGPAMPVLDHGLLLFEAARCRAVVGDREAAAAHAIASFALWDAGQIDGAELRDPLATEFSALVRNR